MSKYKPYFDDKGNLKEQLRRTHSHRIRQTNHTPPPEIGNRKVSVVSPTEQVVMQARARVSKSRRNNSSSRKRKHRKRRKTPRPKRKRVVKGRVAKRRKTAPGKRRKRRRVKPRAKADILDDDVV